MIKIMVLSLLLGSSFLADASGLEALGKDLERLSKINSLSKNSEVKWGIIEASNGIKREALLSSIQEKALADHISVLEEKIKLQQEVISKYEQIISVLRKKLPESK